LAVNYIFDECCYIRVTTKRKLNFNLHYHPRLSDYGQNCEAQMHSTVKLVSQNCCKLSMFQHNDDKFCNPGSLTVLPT